MKQEFTSAKTCIKQIPAGFKIVDKYFGWQPNTMNLDIGGGKYDLFTDALKEKGVNNLVFDPYNRTPEHNQQVLMICESFPADTVTIFNVLNVIKEFDMQIEVLNLALRFVKNEGSIYIRSTYKNQSGKSGVTKSGTFQHCKTQQEYLDEIVKVVFPMAELKHGLIYVRNIRKGW